MCQYMLLRAFKANWQLNQLLQHYQYQILLYQQQQLLQMLILLLPKQRLQWLQLQNLQKSMEILSSAIWQVSSICVRILSLLSSTTSPPGGSETTCLYTQLQLFFT